VADFDSLYDKYNPAMEDFWSRRLNAPKYEQTIRVLGHAVIVCSNHPGVLESATIAERLYSSAPWIDEPPWHITLIVHDARRAAGSPPERLIDRLHYAGADDWLSIGLDSWGHCFVDMARGDAHAILSSELADNPALVAEVLLNTILTNFLTRHGYAMLHASALVKGDRILLLMGPHGAGKSTTALRFALNGYKLLSDSMVYVGEHAGALWMGAFPVGRIKLRKDMLDQFPALAGEAKLEPVRDETKHRLEMDHLAPERTCLEMVPVDRVELCLLERWDKSFTRVDPLSQSELWPQIMVNSLHYDNPAIWRKNLRTVGLLLERARVHRLRIGTSEAGILGAVEGLWTSPS
jgi:hypothetical protein